MSVVPLSTVSDLALTNAEWKRIAKTLPNASQDARRISDRLVIGALLAIEASGMSAEIVAQQFGIAPQTLRTRRARWTHDGTLAKIFDAGAPAIERLRNAYCARYGKAGIEGAQAMEILAKYHWDGTRRST